MKNVYKNPIFYYVLVPILTALWPLLLWGVYLPNANQKWEQEKLQYNKAQKIIEQILTIDPERLDFARSENSNTEFDYGTAVEKIATSCGIPPTSYTLTTRPVITSGQQKSQSAIIILEQISIAEFADFLSTIQLRWANLQCEKVKLTKSKGLPDTWKANLEFKY